MRENRPCVLSSVALNHISLPRASRRSPFATFPTEHDAPPFHCRAARPYSLSGGPTLFIVGRPDIRTSGSSPAAERARIFCVNATIPPGWYSDPADAVSLRWWDGTQWTDHRSAPSPFRLIHPASSPREMSSRHRGTRHRPPSYPGAQPPPVYTGQPQAPYTGAAQPPFYAGAAQPPVYPGYSGGPGLRRSGRMGRTRGPNSFSWTAIGFAAGYLVLAVTTNFVLLGIVPVLSSVRAFQRGEKLAPLAAVAAAVTVATAVYFIGFHHR